MLTSEVIVQLSGFTKLQWTVRNIPYTTQGTLFTVGPTRLLWLIRWQNGNTKAYVLYASKLLGSGKASYCLLNKPGPLPKSFTIVNDFSSRALIVTRRNLYNLKTIIFLKSFIPVII